MESKTKIPFRYVAGGCFAACAFIYFIDSIYYQNLFNFYSLSLILSFAAIAVGLFLSIPMLSTAGSVLLLIYQAVVLFNDVKYNMAYGIFSFDAPVSFYDCTGFFISVLFFSVFLIYFYILSEPAICEKHGHHRRCRPEPYSHIIQILVLEINAAGCCADAVGMRRCRLPRLCIQQAERQAQGYRCRRTQVFRRVGYI